MYILSRNKPIRRPGITPMGRRELSSMYVRPVWSELPEKPRSDVRDPSRGTYGLNRGHRRERLLFQPIQSRQSPIKLRRNYFVHNRCAVSRVNLSW